MTTYRGLDGFLCLGGALTGTPLVKATLTTGATELNVTGGGSTLTGVLVLGDLFTLGGETNTPSYRVKTSCYVATGTAILATIPFEPGVSEEIAANASLTVQSNSMANVVLWDLTAEPEILDNSVMGDAWRTYYSDATLVASWSGRGEAYLDMTDREQARFIESMSPANVIDSPLAFSNWLSLPTNPLAVTTNQADPFGKSQACLLTDDSSTVVEFAAATCTWTTDGEKSVSLYVKEGTATNIWLQVRDTSAPTTRRTIDLVWDSNELTQSSAAGGGTLYPSEEVGFGWHLVKFSVTGVVASNANEFRVAPNNGSTPALEGNASAYGAVASEQSYPGSYSPPANETFAVLLAATTDKQFYGEIKTFNHQITAQRGELVTVSFDFTGTGSIRHNWT